MKFCEKLSGRLFLANFFIFLLLFSQFWKYKGFGKQSSRVDKEAVIQRCSVKKVFLEIHRKKPAVPVFFNKVAGPKPVIVNFTFSYRAPPVAASVDRTSE